MAYTIRRFRDSDSIAELTQLLHQSYAELKAQGWNFTACDQSESVTSERISGRSCWIALDDGRMIATITVGFQSDFDIGATPGQIVAHVNQFAVHPMRRREGIGEALMARAEEEGRANGCDWIALDTAETHRTLIDWYLARGFEPAGTVQWGGKSYRSIVLRKALA